MAAAVAAANEKGAGIEGLDGSSFEATADEAIVTHMNPMNYLVRNQYESDKATIRAIFEQGGYASVHSKEFKQHYHPHYRIVSRKILHKNKRLFLGQPFLR